MSKLTREEFRALRTRAEHDLAQSREVPSILICAGTGCIAGGAMKIYDNFKSECEARGLKVYVGLKHDTDEEKSLHVKMSGCHGFCEMGPLVRIEPEGWLYTKCQVSDVEEIIQKTILGGEFIERLGYKQNGELYERQEDIPFYKKQTRRVLEHCGHIDAESIEEYLSIGGYGALAKALFEMQPDEIVQAVSDSGLRGRGGAGFPTGLKWKFASGNRGNVQKYVCCNADEGDPGAFMDGSTMEGSPHAVIEGMIIGALAIGAETGVLYIRDEYALAREHIQRAIDDAYAAGILGEHIMGSDHKLDLSIVRGGGAFVCGESTALMNSIEGKVGEPRPKYIRSVQSGLFEKPTVLNNVETLASIPTILAHGGEEYAKLGTEKSKGTKVFAMVGKVKHTGLVEVPMGTTLRTLIYDIGGGIIKDRPFKAIQTGGPSGGCIPEGLLDLPVDFDTLVEYGAMMGSGGMIVMDDCSCMVEVARYYIDFLCEESCGKCTPCREGLRQMRYILNEICEGRSKDGDVELLEEIGHMMQDASLCALGRTAPNPVLTTIKFFREEYEEHIGEHRCPAGVCAALTRFAIDPQACKGCGMCAKACPTEAISGERKQPYSIEPAACIACGSCREVCNFNAVLTEGR